MKLKTYLTAILAMAALTSFGQGVIDNSKVATKDSLHMADPLGTGSSPVDSVVVAPGKSLASTPSTEAVSPTFSSSLESSKPVWDARSASNPDPNGEGSPVRVLPEPSTIALCVLGGAGLLLARRRKK